MPNLILTSLGAVEAFFPIQIFILQTGRLIVTAV